jgi:hypothetical protein
MANPAKQGLKPPSKSKRNLKQKKLGFAGDISTCPKVQIFHLANLAPGLNKKAP